MRTDSERVERIAEIARERGLRVVTSESLTSGLVAQRLGAGPEAAEWFGGGIIAYHERVKFDVLGVEEGPVVTSACAVQMARGALSLLGADVAVACTGVGGPEPSEGKRAGTVFIAVATTEDVRMRELSLEGSPEDVIRETTERCVTLLEETLAGGVSLRPSRSRPRRARRTGAGTRPPCPASWS